MELDLELLLLMNMLGLQGLQLLLKDLGHGGDVIFRFRD